MLKAVIFDMDGLMIDTENVTYQCYKDVLKTMNLEMTKEFYTTLLGRTMEATRRAMFDQYGEDFPIEKVAKKVHQLMDEQFARDGVPLKDGLVVLEDSEAGIQAADNAKISVICIPDMKYPDEDYANKTTCILNSLNEVIDYIEKDYPKR